MLDAQTLMVQASDTAATYLDHAILDIDKRLGQGYAKTHPELVAAYMQTAAIDFAATFGMQGIAEALDRIAQRE